MRKTRGRARRARSDTGSEHRAQGTGHRAPFLFLLKAHLRTGEPVISIDWVEKSISSAVAGFAAAGAGSRPTEEGQISGWFVPRHAGRLHRFHFTSLNLPRVSTLQGPQHPAVVPAICDVLRCQSGLHFLRDPSAARHRPPLPEDGRSAGEGPRGGGPVQEPDCGAVGLCPGVDAGPLQSLLPPAACRRRRGCCVGGRWRWWRYGGALFAVRVAQRVVCAACSGQPPADQRLAGPASAELTVPRPYPAPAPPPTSGCPSKADCVSLSPGGAAAVVFD